MAILENFFWVPFAVIAAILLFRILKYGGLRGAIYGAPVARTVGEIELLRKMGSSMMLRVHVLEDGRIVIEQSARAPLAASISGIPLSTTETDRLIAMLQQARSSGKS